MEAYKKEKIKYTSMIHEFLNTQIIKVFFLWLIIQNKFRGSIRSCKNYKRKPTLDCATRTSPPNTQCDQKGVFVTTKKRLCDNKKVISTTKKHWPLCGLTSGCLRHDSLLR